MHTERVHKQHSSSCVLLGEPFRVEGKVRKRTIANLTDWPEAVVGGLQRLLRGESVTGSSDDAFEITSSRPHGHVADVLGTIEKLGLPRLLSSLRSREHDLAIAIGEPLSRRVLLPEHEDRGPQRQAHSPLRARRVRAHVFVGMLAHYVPWHVRRHLAPLLFDDDYKAEA